MAEDRNIAGEISEEDRKIIQDEYGLQKIFGNGAESRTQIISIHELTEPEKEFFSQTSSDTSALSLQMLYKFHGSFVPVRFTKELNRIVEGDPMLRSGYCVLNDRVVRVAFQETKAGADIIYRNLGGQPPEHVDVDLYNYMVADMRQPFDIACGPLFRFAVFHTGKNEYAVLLTVLGVIKDRLDISGLFDSMGLIADEDVPAVPGEKTKTKTEEKQPEEKKCQITDEVRRYWAELLTGMPPMPAIPYCGESGRPFSQKAYRLPGLDAYAELLAKKSEGRTEKFICILQTAWGLYLQHVNHSADVCCCVLAPMEDGAGQTMIPLRLKVNPGFTVDAVIEKQLRQFLASRACGSAGKKAMGELLGEQRRLFNHILNFGAFGGYAKAASGGAVAENAWNLQGLPLGVYFHFLPSGLSAVFLYDEGRFPPGGVERLAWEFEMTLYHVLAHSGSTLAEFHEKLEGAFTGKTPGLTAKQEPVETILSEIPLFRGISGKALQRLAARAEISVRYEGDYIMSFAGKPTVYFLAEGQLARLMDSGSGWLNMLDIVMDGAWVNETVLLPKCKSKCAAEVISEDARLVSLPLEDFQAVLETEPKITNRALLSALKEMEKYQRYWTDN